MQIESTHSMRPVSHRVHSVIGDLPSGSFNFGLYFQKWFYVRDDTHKQPPKKWKRGSPGTCSLYDETPPVSGDQYCMPNKHLDNLHVSIALFNGQKQYYREKPKQNQGKRKEGAGQLVDVGAQWNRTLSGQILKAKHGALDAYATALEYLGYEHIKVRAELLSSLVVGLGNEHPSEKGFRFDWNLGIPMIPASSIKGVVRLAYLVNELNSLQDATEETVLAFCRQIVGTDDIPEPAASMFGTGGDKNPRRGKVIFLDAYPETLPRLKAEIMNCHYKDYLNKGGRGPTEDQDPNPQRYWAVDQFIDGDKRLGFVFRFLIHRDIAADQAKRESLLAGVTAALGDHGLGSKTALGHGRFRPAGERPDGTRDQEDKKQQGKPSEVSHEIWEGVTVEWNPGRQEIRAISGAKTGFTKNQTAVAEDVLARLKKKKSIKANVKVEPLGGNNFKIIEVTLSG